VAGRWPIARTAVLFSIKSTLILYWIISGISHLN